MTSVADQASARSCRYCGLPLARPPGDSYCCFGCRWAAAISVDNGEEGLSRRMLARLGVSIFFTVNVMVFTMALWTRDVYDENAGSDFVPLGTSPADVWCELLRYAGLGFSVPVFLLLGVPLLESAWLDLRQRRLTIDPLIAVGVCAAFAYSVVSLVLGGRHVYFEVGCVVLVAITLGRWLEATGKLKTMQALRSLERLLPDTVRRVVRRDHLESQPSDQWVEVPASDVQVGDQIRVFPGERICVDGCLERNPALVDEQLITGESQPVVKGPGTSVHAGSLNLDGDLWVRVTEPFHSGTLQRLIAAVQAAANARGREQRLADRVTGWFIPVVGLAAVGSFAWHAWTHDIGSGMLAALAVLLIACPCALGIATPMAVWGALTQGARNQVLFRDGDALSRLARVRTVCFDKTGTLTTGEAEVCDVLVSPGAAWCELLQRGAQLARASPHSLSRAIHRFADQVLRAGDSPMVRIDVGPPSVRVTTHPGLGLVCPTPGDVAGLGSPRLMGQLRFQWPPGQRERMDEVAAAGSAVSCCGWDGVVQGVFVFRETLRPEARACITALVCRGIEVRVLSGDLEQRSRHLATDLQVPVHAGLLPDEKQALVGQLAHRVRPRCVAMVGDGINDAPALAASDVGVALGCGADVSREVADVCLLGNDLSRLPWAIELAHGTMRTVRQNLFWAFVYNVVGVGLAAAGWLNPVFAAAAMVGSSLLVIGNSLRFARGGPAQTRDVPQTADIRVGADPARGSAQAEEVLVGA